MEIYVIDKKGEIRSLQILRRKGLQKKMRTESGKF